MGPKESGFVKCSGLRNRRVADFKMIQSPKAGMENQVPGQSRACRFCRARKVGREKNNDHYFGPVYYYYYYIYFLAHTLELLFRSNATKPSRLVRPALPIRGIACIHLKLQSHGLS